MAAAFTHRTLTGWISEYAGRPLPGAWPQIPLDDDTLSDFEAYFDLCRDSGYNEVVIWGFFVDRRWPVDISSCIDGKRRGRIHRVLGAAHARGLKAHCGLGLYSWGFDAIIEAHPHLSRDNPRVMCPSVPEPREWMEKVIDFVMDRFAFDGLNMQSADNGRCTCSDCGSLSTVEYHARLNLDVARYIHAKWPDKCLIMDNWGCPFSNPSDLSHLVPMSEEMGYVIDHNNSAMEAGRGYRKALAQALACPFGTLAGRSVWPPQRWSRDKWFLPTTLSNVDYVRDLYEDGARAAEQFATTRVNPSDEITLRFMGGLLSDVNADPEKLLRAAVEATYEPVDAVTLDGLVEVVRTAERAYIDRSGRDLASRTGLIYVDGGLMPKEDPSPETYLLDMSPADRAAYAEAIAGIAADFDRLRSGVGQREKADLTAQCFQTVLADARRIGGR